MDDDPFIFEKINFRLLCKFSQPFPTPSAKSPAIPSVASAKSSSIPETFDVIKPNSVACYPPDSSWMRFETREILTDIELCSMQTRWFSSMGVNCITCFCSIRNRQLVHFIWFNLRWNCTVTYLLGICSISDLSGVYCIICWWFYAVVMKCLWLAVFFTAPERHLSGWFVG